MALELMAADDIRTLFSQSLSNLYQQEVPLYSQLLSLVATVNSAVLKEDPYYAAILEQQGELPRLNIERHGAIRVGKAEELATLRRIFAVMGMFPVGYYDLTQAGVPVQSTAFRPIDDQALQRNPLRIFTSLLQLEAIEDLALRQRAQEILAQRKIFSPRCLALLDLHQRQGGLCSVEAQEFVHEALGIFRWQGTATVDQQTYQFLHNAHRLIADVVCFATCHINHLTPRTLDIDRAQGLMSAYGMTAKTLIEGPPRRKVDILLRQTSFSALAEPIVFKDGHRGFHTARFGEIEQRGIALTPKGRALYDSLLMSVEHQQNNSAQQLRLSQAFEVFADDETQLRQQGLAYFRYSLTALGEKHRHSIKQSLNIEQYLAKGWLRAETIIYEDFLPVSAAGIFQSNLSGERGQSQPICGSQSAFEQSLGAAVIDPFSLYQQAEQNSKQRCGLID